MTGDCKNNPGSAGITKTVVRKAEMRGESKRRVDLQLPVQDSQETPKASAVSCSEGWEMEKPRIRRELGERRLKEKIVIRELTF